MSLARANWIESEFERRKSVRQSWRHPPTHSWKRAKGGAGLEIKWEGIEGERKLTRSWPRLRDLKKTNVERAGPHSKPRNLLGYNSFVSDSRHTFSKEQHEPSCGKLHNLPHSLFCQIGKKRKLIGLFLVQFAANCFAFGTVVAAAQHTFVKKTIEGLGNVADSALARRSNYSESYRYSVAHPALVLQSSRVSTNNKNKTWHHINICPGILSTEGFNSITTW